MAQIKKVYRLVCSGTADKSIRFADLQKLILALGFDLARISGDHFIYTREGMEEIINIQPDKGDPSKAKSFQVRQLRRIITKYSLEV